MLRPYRRWTSRASLVWWCAGAYVIAWVTSMVFWPVITTAVVLGSSGITLWLFFRKGKS
jgi:hypothetical protein